MLVIKQHKNESKKSNMSQENQEQHHPKSMQACSKVSTFFFYRSLQKRPLFSNMDMKTIMMILTTMMNLSQWLQNQRPKSITIASTNRQEKDVENKSSYELDQMIYKHRPIKQACLLF